jgi:hypothetical protein
VFLFYHLGYIPCFSVVNLPDLSIRYDNNERSSVWTLSKSADDFGVDLRNQKECAVSSLEWDLYFVGPPVVPFLLASI